MEAQPPSAPAASAATAVTAAAPPGPSLSPTQQVQAPSSPGNQPVNPPPNPETHYPNGLPRSINGLNGDAATGSEPTPPAKGSPGSTTPAQPAVPSPTATATATPSWAARAVAAVAAVAASSSAPAPAPPPAPVYTSTPTPIVAKPLKPMVIYTPSSPHPHSQPRQPLQRQSSTGSAHKISIVDPPRAYSRPRSNSQLPNISPTQGFPSPRREHHLENPKFADDLSRLTHAMQQSVPAAVRRVIRDNWEKCLLGSEFHHAFLLNAVIHHSNGVIIRRSIKDFGAKMVSESKHEIISHLSTADLNELVNEILEKASDYFLDQALEKRLRTIDARSLINALARAERLGYENSDVLDDQKGNRSRFNPAPFDPSPQPVQITPISKPHQKPGMPTQLQPLARGPAPPTVLQCPLCWRKFENPQPYEYHVQKQVCTKEPPNKEGFPFSCMYCGAGFITKVGQQYHVANHVCGEHGTVPATPKGPANAGSPITLSSGNNSPVQPPSTLAYPPGSQQKLPATPQHTAAPVYHQPVSTPRSQPKEQDAYAHLHPATRERLDDELRQAELTYTARFKEAEAIQDPAQRQLKIDGLQNSFSTKQSIIRKKYGVRLRNRRTRAEIDNERQRMGFKHSNPVQAEDTPSAKRQRTEDGPSHPNPQAPLSSNGPELNSNHIPVADMSSGLGGSSATAATTDPTLPKPSSSQQHQKSPEQNSLSSLQRKGYRVSSHLPQSNQVSPTDTTIEGSTPQRSGSASAPVIVDDNDSSDSDSDGDIPASLPPRRASNEPSSTKGLAG
ncbi:hypothetical protein F5Y00DRAFT_230009 [Daldinia vernicosa]|uniref:uncharacterized protein n=1 Tax=Daldinia vernicosa TaxID=114800 RepID=UPI002008252B|nr:uncharacterized protein F5Y00DRAFT_230009 [Daldinia vernicosa]KAI0851529.1 hypothetical protein F5Y00DRAFT_230009 [Daldinia vernicosa]